MAIHFLNSIDLNQNQLIKPRIENLGGDPSGVEGQIYFNTNTFALKLYANGSWKSIDDSSKTKVNSVSNAFGTFITGTTNVAASGIVSLGTINLSATGTPSASTYLRGDNTWAAAGSDYTWILSSEGGATGVVYNGYTVKFTGLTNQIVATRTFVGMDIGLADNVVIATSLTVTGTGQNSFGGQVTIPTTPVASTDAASKAYVDASVTGALVFQGGYNATTNTPNLDSPPTGVIKKGFMYTVTVDGLFFTEQVRIGDSLIANINTPTTLADWTRVQSNIDLATLTTVGIGNVNAGAGIDVAYSNGTATVSAQVTSYAATISTSETVAHNLGTKDVIVQLYDTVTSETIYADVVRTMSNYVTVTFAAVPTNPIRVIVQK